MADALTDAFRTRLEASAKATPIPDADVARAVLGYTSPKPAPDTHEELRTTLKSKGTDFDTFDVKAVARTFAYERALGLHDEPWYEVMCEITYPLTNGWELIPVTDNAWDRALLIARAHAVLGQRQSAPDTPLIYAAEAGDRLHAHGFQFEARDGALHFAQGESERATDRLLTCIGMLGGIETLRRVFATITPSYRYDQYLLARAYNSVGLSEPVIPIGFIVNLAVRAEPFATSTVPPDDIWNSLMLLAGDIAAVLGVQSYSRWELINVAPKRGPDAIAQLTLGDHVFFLRQWPIELAPHILDAVFAPVAADMKAKLGWDHADAAALSAVLAQAQPPDPAIYPRAQLFDLSTPAGQNLMSALTNETPNQQYASPTSATQADLMLKPFVGIDADRLYCSAASMAGPAFYEAVMTAYELATSKAERNKLSGGTTERVIAAMFTHAGFTPTVTGKEYPIPGKTTGGECDLVFDHLHRALGRSRHRAVRGQRRRFLRQRARRKHQRPLQGRKRSGGAARGARSKPLNSPPSNGSTGSTTRGFSNRSATSPGRGRSQLLCSPTGTGYGRVTQTWSPPRLPGRFRQEERGVSSRDRRRLVAIAGGSGSGKSTLAQALAAKLPDDTVILPEDNYYRPADPHGNDAIDINFDDPDAKDSQLFLRQVDQAINGEAVEMPLYDFATFRRLGCVTAPPGHYLIVEGLHVLRYAAVLRHADVTVFMRSSRETRLARLLLRDVGARGHDRGFVEKQFSHFIDPMHEKFVEPQAERASITLVNEFEAPLDITNASEQILLLMHADRS